MHHTLPSPTCRTQNPTLSPPFDPHPQPPQVVDNVNHTFFTAGWDATSQSDLRHWCRLPGYSALHSEVVASRGRAAGLVGHPWVYMRCATGAVGFSAGFCLSCVF